MQSRLDYQTASPDTMKALLALEQKVRASGLEHSLVELVKTRASQINGCAFCIHMHTRDARAAGESEDRLHLLTAWRESPLYSARERAALAWTESLTRIADTGASEADFAQARDAFTDDELAKLTLLIGTINIWNRFAIGFRAIHPVD